MDIGCGAGILSESLTRLGFGQVHGIDPTQRVIQMAKSHSELFPEIKKHLEYTNTTVEDYIEKTDLKD